MKAFVLATGPSLTQDQVDAVRGRGTVMAVSDAFRLAPWADFLVSTDRAWWEQHPDALAFAGRKFAAVDVEGVERVPGMPSGINSGLVAATLATQLGAKTVVLLGLDMRGAHFFGAHPEPLTNTSIQQFEEMKWQFEAFRPDGVQLLNATPGSALECLPRVSLESVL